MSTARAAPTPAAEAFELGRRLRRIRKARGLTCRDLALRLGLAGTDIAQIEAGAYKVDLDTLVQILSVLRATPADLAP